MEPPIVLGSYVRRCSCQIYKGSFQKDCDCYLSAPSTPSTLSASSISLWSRPASSSSSSSSLSEGLPDSKEGLNGVAQAPQLYSHSNTHAPFQNSPLSKQVIISTVKARDNVAINKVSDRIVIGKHDLQDDPDDDAVASPVDPYYFNSNGQRPISHNTEVYDPGLYGLAERDISSLRIHEIAEVEREAFAKSRAYPDASNTRKPSLEDRINDGPSIGHLFLENQADLQESEALSSMFRSVTVVDGMLELPKSESSDEGALQQVPLGSDGAASSSNSTRGPSPTYYLRNDLQIPGSLPIPTFDEKHEHTKEQIGQVDSVTTKSAADSQSTLVISRYGRAVRGVKKWLYHHYYLTEEPVLILPSAPSDEEKTSYLVTHRVALCIAGVLAFLSSSSGVWLFTLCGNIFYWFGFFAGFLQLYLALFHLTGLVSKNFDYKLHQKMVEEYAVTEDAAPTVDIFLPCCKEPLEILENTYQYVAKMVYPEGRLKVHVLDDGAMEEVKALAARYGFNYICRDDRPRLKKAGNLRWAFARTDGEYFVIYDADFCPRHDYLTELIPRMKANPNVAIIQTPQYFRTLDTQTWVERGAGAVQELFYRYIQVNRDKWGGAICVGSNAMYRREALAGTGGTAEVGASEDVHTGFYAVNNGWTLSYVPLNLACGICPDNPRAFFSQQLRWCEGSTSLLINWDFWKSNLTKTQKMCYLSGMLYYSASVLTIFTNPLPGILLMWFRIEFLLYYNLVFAVPSLLYGWFIYRIWSRSKHSMCVQFTGVIQQYAYLSALKDRIVGSSFAWVPSGDNKAHQSPRYRNMRWLCICWTFTYNGFFISGCVYRLLEGHAWYNFFPLILLDAFMLYKTLPFMLAS